MKLFNRGVRSGDFSPMLEPFADDAELVFAGLPLGPFKGKKAIAAVYRDRPPDDEIRLGQVRQEGGELVGDYEWTRGGGGELRLTVDKKRITRLVVTVADDAA